MSHKTIEDSYCLKDAEHEPGTNKYTFTWNFQWRNIIQEHLTVSVRSIKLWLAPRHLWMDNLPVVNNTSSTCSFKSFDVSIVGSMLEFNDKATSQINDTWKVYYNPTNKRLVFDCEEGYSFSKGYLIDDPLPTMSSDLQAITGKVSTDAVEVLHSDANNNPINFCFNNVWDRRDVHVRASFVDLGYQRFLGITNEQFIPPKEYPICYADQKFSIELYDSSDNPVELPTMDSKDTLLIELILNSYT